VDECESKRMYKRQAVQCLRISNSKERRRNERGRKGGKLLRPVCTYNIQCSFCCSFALPSFAWRLALKPPCASPARPHPPSSLLSSPPPAPPPRLPPSPRQNIAQERGTRHGLLKAYNPPPGQLPHPVPHLSQAWGTHVGARGRGGRGRASQCPKLQANFENCSRRNIGPAMNPRPFDSSSDGHPLAVTIAAWPKG